MAQLALTARVAGLTGQLLVGAKSPLLVPVVVLLVIVIGRSDERGVGRGGLGVPARWLGKLTLVPDRLATGAKPTPARLTSCCALPKLLSLMARVAVRLNGAVGVKVTLMAQLALAARVAGLTGQLLVGAKSPLLVPVVVMLLIVIG